MTFRTDFYIIEHPTRGILFDFVSEEEFHFSWSASRSDEKVDKFFQLAAAVKVYDRLPASIRDKCVIRFSGPKKVTKPYEMRGESWFTVVWPEAEAGKA